MANMDQVYPGVSRSRSRAPAGGALLRDRSTGRCVARRFEMQCGMPPQRTLPAGRSVTAGLRARPLHQVWLGNVNAARDLQGLLSVGVTHVLNCAALQCPTFYPQVRACGSRRPVLVCACPRPRPRSIQAVLSSPTSRARWSALLPCRLRRSGPR